MSKHSYGDGTIDERGPDTFRLRYRLAGKRYSVTFRGTRAEAKKELRRLVRSGDDNTHIEPTRITLTQWIDRWLALLSRSDGAEPGKRKRGLVSPRTAEGYAQLLSVHVKPTLGHLPLQKLNPSQIDDLYVQLEQKLSTRTVNHVHVTLKSCLESAKRKDLIAANPAERAEAPSPGDSQAGQVLDSEQLKTLVQAFRHSVLYPIVAVACHTGARRNEILALRWTDLDVAAKTIRIERSLEQTQTFGRRTKEPKTARGTRTIQIDDDLIALLLAEREKHLRIKAGVPDGAPVDLALIKLPPDALMFPSPGAGGESFDFTRLRNANAVTQEFTRQARRIFPKLRFHDLRGSHETALLDAGTVPLHVVAARCGHDPAVLLRSYAKRTKKADSDAAAAIGALLKGAIGID